MSSNPPPHTGQVQLSAVSGGAVSTRSFFFFAIVSLR
jgi:hypothetical protein